MNLLVLNLGMDADHSALGHTSAWVNALARRCEHVSVITMFKGRLDVEANVDVHSLGKERGLSEPRRLVRFYALVRRILRERRVDACFAHMAPLFTVLLAPVARRHRIPILLWYAHASVTPTLRLAHAVADRCVTSTPAGFRLESDKLHVLGQGVDVERFRPPQSNGAPPEPAAVSVGRITPIKHIEEMLEAVALLRRERHVEIPLRLYGEALSDGDRAYLADLRRRAAALDLNGLVSWEGPLSFERVPDAYHRGEVFLNLSETGSIDKAILESMASGCIPVSRNASFESLARAQGLEWLVPGRGPGEVADRIAGVLERPRAEREEVASTLRRIVAERHSLERLADALMAHLRELSETKVAR